MKHMLMVGAALALMGASCNPPNPNPTPVPVECACVKPAAAEDTWVPTTGVTWNTAFIAEACVGVPSAARSVELASKLAEQLQLRNVCAFPIGEGILAGRPDGAWETWGVGTTDPCVMARFEAVWIIPGTKACKGAR